MKKNILQRAFYFFIFLAGLHLALPGYAAPARDFYAIKVYHLKNKIQEDRVDDYLQKAYLPAVHRAGIKQVGVFKPLGNDTARVRKIYVFLPLQSLDQVLVLDQKLKQDKQHNTIGQDYLDALHTNAPYVRIETILLQAFTNMPKMMVPKFKTLPKERVYELRSYEGHTEKRYLNKVKMFNEGGEVNIFKKLGFNAVFYAEVIAGSRMPNLMYMTTFENRAARDAHWDTFRSDPDWKKLSGLSEYKNSVSRNDTNLLHPTDYSDI